MRKAIAFLYLDNAGEVLPGYHVDIDWTRRNEIVPGTKLQGLFYKGKRVIFMWSFQLMKLDIASNVFFKYGLVEIRLSKDQWRELSQASISQYYRLFMYKEDAEELGL